MDPYVRQFFAKPDLSSGTSAYTAYRENPPPPRGLKYTSGSVIRAYYLLLTVQLTQVGTFYDLPQDKKYNYSDVIDSVTEEPVFFWGGGMVMDLVTAIKIFILF